MGFKRFACERLQFPSVSLIDKTPHRELFEKRALTPVVQGPPFLPGFFEEKQHPPQFYGTAVEIILKSRAFESETNSMAILG